MTSKLEGQLAFLKVSPKTDSQIKLLRTKRRRIIPFLSHYFKESGSSQCFVPLSRLVFD
jgi:hypothetical protein